MRVKAVKPCAFWDINAGRIEIEVGSEVELDDAHATVAIAEGWAEPLQSAEDAEAGAPKREKAAARKAPEKK